MFRVNVLALCTLCVSWTLSLSAAEPKQKVQTNSLGMKLVWIEPGEFMMGTAQKPPTSVIEWAERDFDESPVHAVKISAGFWLGAHEVTNAQYEKFEPKHRDWRGKFSVSRTDDEPVTFVTWDQAVAFCAWLNEKEKLPVGLRYRLPTEAEWEYACRAGTTTPFYTGSTVSPEQANFGKSATGEKQTTVSVGKFSANAWGVHDLLGNVAEWCHDWYGPYTESPKTDPVGYADGIAKITRGWSYAVADGGVDNRRYGRSANRSGQLPGDAHRATGFRVVLGPALHTKPLTHTLPLCQQHVKQQAAPTVGPDPTKPYYLNYTQAGKNPTIPANTWGPIFSQHNHYGAVTVCPNGDVLAVWYSTKSESGRELSIAGSRLRAGEEKWEPASCFFDVPDMNDHAPVLLTVGKRVYHFCLQGIGGWDDASIVQRISEDSGASWGQPTIILGREHPQKLSQPCSAFATKSGTLVLACDGDRHVDERVLTSNDAGKSWRVGKGDMRATQGAYAIHPAVVPLDDGSLLSFLRGPNPMPMQRSKDLGDSWTTSPSPFPGLGSGQKPAALKLASGALLLCSLDTKATLTPSKTFAALSLDDGKTWAHVQPIEGVGGYMSVAQAPNGVIYLFGSRMGCVAFNEAWLKQGKALRK